jgi:hypothetical protein
MRHDLLGYLLNALDEPERQAIFEALQEDPQLRQELEALRRELRPLDATNADFEPPPELAELTCDLVAAYAAEGSQVVQAAGRADGQRSRQARQRGRFATRETLAATSGWSAADAIVIAGILLAAAFLFFPAIAGSRYRSQIATCGENLRHLGLAMAGYSEHNRGFFPSIPVSGNRAAAGIYAIILNEGGYLESPRVVLCPGSRMAAQQNAFRIPTLAELDQAQGPDLWELHRMMGGTYGYTLGNVADGRYRTPRNRLRSHFALLADVPSLHLPGRQSGNHAGRGQNVLFEDLHIEFLTSPQREAFGEDFFRNRHGYIEAGVDEGDSVVVPSFVRPLLGY